MPMRFVIYVYRFGGVDQKSKLESDGHWYRTVIRGGDGR